VSDKAFGDGLVAAMELDKAKRIEATRARIASLQYYPDLICFDCGRKHGRARHSNRISTVHLGVCDICQRYTSVTEPRDFNHLRDTWRDAYEQAVAVFEREENGNRDGSASRSGGDPDERT